MRKVLGALAAGAVFIAVPSAAQTAGKTVQLSKVVMDTETPIKGKIKGGTLCVFPSKWKLNGEKKTQDYERFDRLFSERMKARGFAPITTSADMFAGASDQNKADYLFGATVKPDTINLCSSVNGEKGDMILIVDWQVYDRAAQKVVATTTTTATSRQEKFSHQGLTAMFDQAFVANLDVLVEEGKVEPYIGKAGARPAEPAPEPVPATTAAKK
ncbi:hypothetical protein [Sphingomonas sp. KR3-1]|uniref:hypothetical protein n=1 Tax=Sphingomonas sp. KR3-1 TaxID=3156611 RepID=UPI0032B4FD06